VVPAKPHHLTSPFDAWGSRVYGQDVWANTVRPQMEVIAIETLKAAQARVVRVQVGWWCSGTLRWWMASDKVTRLCNIPWFTERV